MGGPSNRSSVEPNAPSQRVRILFLTASPSDTSRIAADAEYRAIEACIRTSKSRDSFDLTFVSQVRASELQHLLQRHQPTVVHFSAHGSDTGELLLLDEAGQASPTAPEFIAQTFAILSRHLAIRCVLLNGCYSKALAETLARHVDCVIGMSEALDERAAVAFAGSFYDSMAFNCDLATAHRLACNQLGLVVRSHEKLPMLHRRQGVKTGELELMTGPTSDGPGPDIKPVRARRLVQATVIDPRPAGQHAAQDRSPSARDSGWRLCPECRTRYETVSGRCPLDGARLVDAPDPLLGRVFNERYRLVEQIGAGSVGMVYRARHVVLQREVAIKVLKASLALDPEQKRRFVGEAEAANLLHHENIVDIFDCGVDGEHLYLAMDLLDGESLAQRLARTALTTREAIEVAVAVARALVRAHELRIVHRDIKPGNIFLCKRGTPVKVLDFGIAHIQREVRLTRPGQIIGTPEYMPPEVVKEAPSTPASDLYSLGVTLFEMLTRTKPFSGSATILMGHHLHTTPPRLRTIDPAQPQALDDIVAKLLAKNPADRHRDAHHLIEALEALRGSVAPRPPGAPRAVEETIPPTRQTSWDECTTADSPEDLDSWRGRRATLAAAVASTGSAPQSEAHRLLDEFDRELAHVPAIEAEVDALIKELAVVEHQGNARRERIAHALDTLTREESAVAREIEGLGGALSAARTSEERLREELGRARDGAGVRGEITPDVAVALEALGVAAARWREARRERDEFEERARRLEAAQYDLTFQIAQFRGRVAAITMELDHDVNILRERMAVLGRRLGDQHHAFSRIADRFVQQLPAVPMRGG